MPESNRNNGQITEDGARRIICTNIAQLLQAGTCTVRIRRLNGEGRVTFLAESHNRWEPRPNMDYQGQHAEQIVQALLPLANKRGKDVHVTVHSSGNHDDVTIGFHRDNVTQHRSNLYQYVFGQLFWD
jgi:hypothetical protein